MVHYLKYAQYYKLTEVTCVDVCSKIQDDTTSTINTIKYSK